MYESYFGLTERPFSIAPDPQYLYMSARHKEAMAHLSYGLSQGGCFIVLTGEVGTGKTTLCRNLMTDLPDNVDLALILNANINETELLQTICDELKISFEDTHSQKQLLDLINQHLLSTFAGNRHTVLIIDEAQLLSRDVLEQVRLLTNLETTKHKLLQIILIGQPELSDMLTRNDLRQLAQRVTARYHLGELKRSEIEDYVNYRLGVAGCKQPLFSSQALSKLHQFTDGIPRKINVLADHALLSAYAQKQRLVDSHNVKDSAKEVFFTTKASSKISLPIIKWGLLALVLVLLNVFFWWYFVGAKQTASELSQPPIDVDTTSADITALEPESSFEVTPELTDSESQNQLLTAQENLLEMIPVDEPVVQAEDESIDPDIVDSTVQADAQLATDSADIGEVVESSTGPGSVLLSEEYLDAEDGVVETVEESAALVSTVELSQAESDADRALREQTEFGSILETSADLTGRITAFRELTKLWGEELPSQFLLPMCEEVQADGLQCAFFSNWNQLLRLNRPAVLVLRHDNQLHRVVLDVLDGDAAEVRIGESIYRISVEELKSRWQDNDGMFIWRPSEAGSELLQQGDTAPLLPVVRGYLNRALEQTEVALLTELASPEFDSDLSQKVLGLQRAFGVIADGKIGNETYLLMNELAQPDSTPVLRNRLPE